MDVQPIAKAATYVAAINPVILLFSIQIAPSYISKSLYHMGLLYEVRRFLSIVMSTLF